MVTVKAFPTLRGYLPSEFFGKEGFSLDLSTIKKGQVSIDDLVSYLEIPRDRVFMVILNGIINKDFSIIIHHGDTIFLSTPVAGG